MTLGIVLANADQIIQVTDRRLTANGKLVDDSSTKAGFATCDDACFLYCYTGLATVGSTTPTHRWLLDALYEATKRGHRFQDIDIGLAECASKYFRDSVFVRRLAARDRRLTIMLSGYTMSGYIVSSLVSNFQDFKTFTDHQEANPEFAVHPEISIRPASENPTMIQVIGQFGAVLPSDERELRKMLEERRPSIGISQKAVALIQEISDRPRSHGTVGKKINIGEIKRENPRIPYASSASDIAESEMHFIDQVKLETGVSKFMVSDVTIKYDSPAIFPRVHRNAPCPCGSGKRFRQCHR